MKDIHPIRPPVSVGFDPGILYLLLWILAGLVVLALAFFLFRKWRKNRKNEAQPLQIPLIPPFEAAKNALAALSGQAVSDPREFYFELTLILRKYIGGTFNTRAAEMTTQEFVRLLLGLDIETHITQEAIAFCHDSDPFKYAGIKPDGAEVKKIAQKVEQMIEQIEIQVQARKEESREE